MPLDYKSVKLIFPSSRVNPQSYYYNGYFDARSKMDRKASKPLHLLGDKFAFEEGNDDGQIDFYTSSRYNPATVLPADHSRYLSQNCMQDIHDWNNVEITNYITVNDAPSNGKIKWRVRTGYDNKVQGNCESCGYEAELTVSGDIRFIKRQYCGGSTSKPYQHITNDIEGRTVGLKFLVYNKLNSVNLEIYLDENNSGYWVPKHSISDIRDFGSGGLYCKGLAADQQIRWGGPIISLLWNVSDVSQAVEFSKFSIREIDPSGKFLLEEPNF